MLDLKAIHKAQRDAARSYKTVSTKIAKMDIPQETKDIIDKALDEALTKALSDLSLENLSKLQSEGQKNGTEKEGKKAGGKKGKEAAPAV